MKKLFMSFMAAWLTMHLLYGSPVNPQPIVYTQPDGSKVTLRCRGDEYGLWVETVSNADVVVRNDKGYFEYATIRNNEIVASGVRVRATTKGEALAAPKTLASRANMANLMCNQREKLMLQLDSMEQRELLKMDNQQQAVRRAKAKVTPLPQVPNPKVLCIMMEFEDYRFTHTRKEFEDMWNKPGYRAPNETDGGSVRDYYLENSYGQMDVQATVIGPFTAKYKYKHYKRNGTISCGLTFTKAIELATEAINAAIKHGYKLENFDSNGDKTVDAVHIIFAGPAVFPTYENEPGLFWPHHSWALVAQGAYRTWDFMITPEFDGNGEEDKRIADVGTVCHEFGHILGAPDFYDTTLKDQIHGTGYPGTGGWDIMCSGGGDCPPHHNPFTKTYIYGWVSPTELAKSGNVILPTDKDKIYTLRPVDKTKDIYIMPTGTDNEFFMFENKAGTGFNKNIGRNNGGNLLIYHIHQSIFPEIGAFGNIATINATHPQKCYIVNANATMNPDRTEESYNGGKPGNYNWSYSWSYPDGDAKNIFFTANSMPSAISWKGEPTGADVCFIHRDGENIQFVVNPQIEGPNTANKPDKYTQYKLTKEVNTHAVEAGKVKDSIIMKIKWTYTYIPCSVEEARQTASPIILYDSKWYAYIKPGQYPVVQKQAYKAINAGTKSVNALNKFEPSLPIDGGEIIQRPNFVTYEYFKGTVILNATFTCGKNSYTMSKVINLADNTTNKKPALTRTVIDEPEDNEEMYTIEPMQGAYRLVYENPVMGTAHIRVEKYEDGAFVPYEGDYILSVYGDRIGMAQYSASNQADYTLECENLPLGIYQLVLQVNNQVVATSKMLKVY